MSESKCPVCDRPPTSRNYEKTGCHMWWILKGGGCAPSSSDLRECYEHAKPWRDNFHALQLELGDTKAKLAAAQRALSRHHAAAIECRTGHAITTVDMFPDGARIE